MTPTTPAEREALGLPPPFADAPPTWCVACPSLAACRVQWAKYFWRHALNCPAKAAAREAVRCGVALPDGIDTGPDLTMRDLAGVAFVRSPEHEPIWEHLRRLAACVRADGVFRALTPAAVWLAYRRHPELLVYKGER